MSESTTPDNAVKETASIKIEIVGSGDDVEIRFELESKDNTLADKLAKHMITEAMLGIEKNKNKMRKGNKNGNR